jgi:hypothetical protein
LKITIKRIGTKLNIKIQWKEMLVNQIEEKQINQKMIENKKKQQLKK